MNRGRWLLASGLASVALGALLWPQLARPSLFVRPLAIELGEPRWLVLLAAAPSLIVTAWLSLTDHGPLRRGIQTALRLLFLGCLAAAMARPARQEPSRAISVVVLADVSASMSDEAIADERRFIGTLVQQAARRSPPALVRLVRFAGRAEEVPLRPGEPPPLERLPEEADDTDLALALGVGLGLGEPAALNRILLMSDGGVTRGDPLREAARAYERGARLDFLRPAGPGASDVALLDLAAPDGVQARAGFPLELRIVATHAGQARVRLVRDGRPQVDDAEAEREVTLSPGLNTVRWTGRLAGADPAIFEATLVSAEGNGRPENDRALLAIAPDRPPRVLVLETGRRAGPAFLRALAAEGIEGDLRAPKAWSDLAPYDLVALSDISPAALSAEQSEALARHVRAGGGLLVAGGPVGLGAGLFDGHPLGALLPVRHNPTERHREATLALVLVIDRSGSMSGPKMDLTKEAARGTAQMLSPEDLIAVVVFDSQAHPVVRLQTASNRQRILNDIAQIRASGGTNIFAGLREGVEQLLVAQARKKHVILLSDGQSPYEGIQELVDDAATARITVSAVGVGEGADQTLLQMIASRGGGRFYHTRDPASIPQIFTRETAEVSRPFGPDRPTRMAVGSRAEALKGVPVDAAPPLRGFTPTRAKPSADVLLVTDGGEPLLARWQVGLGQVAVWTSDLAGGWSAALARWSGFPKMWGQIVRSTMRRGAQNRFPLVTRLSGDRALVWLHAVGADDRPLGGLDGELEIRDVSPQGQLGGPRRAPLVEVVPGRYEAEIELDKAAALLLSASLRAGDGRAVVAADGRLSVPLAPELTPALPASTGERGRSLLQALAARTGGGEVRQPDRLLDEPPPRHTRQRPLRTPLTVVAVALFLADVASRRARLRRS